LPATLLARSARELHVGFSQHALLMAKRRAPEEAFGDDETDLKNTASDAE
jgi:hypothetical protein